MISIMICFNEHSYHKIKTSWRTLKNDVPIFWSLRLAGLPTLDVSNVDIECHYVEILHEYQKNVLIINMYRPPQGNIENFVNYLEQIMSILDKSKMDIIFMGGLNIDFMLSTEPSTKKMNRFISQNGFIKLISEITRYGTTKNSCLDQIITNSNHILKAGIANLNISDHQMVYFLKKKSKSNPVKTSFTGRSYINYDYNQFEEALNNCDWEDFNIQDNPNILWNIFLENMNSALSQKEIQD